MNFFTHPIFWGGTASLVSSEETSLIYKQGCYQHGQFSLHLYESESDVTYDQVCCPILGICALHLTHPRSTHTVVNTHTVGSHLCCGARGAVGGSVPCSRAPKSWYWGCRERCTFTPPTYNSCQTDSNLQPFDYESDSLTISLNNLELNTLKTVEMTVDFRRNPPCSPPTHHHEQHCDRSGVIQTPGHRNFSGPEVGQSYWVHGEKGTAEAVLPSSAEEVQPARSCWNSSTPPSLNPSSAQSLGYICSNSQKYIVWIKMMDYSVMPKIIRILSKDHVPLRYFVNFLP